MISIVVCHRDETLLDQFQLNVTNTIGVPFEFVIIDNKKNDYTIFQAYNLGVERSQFDIICFAHEDLLFHTVNWGKNVINHFKEVTTGMIGVIGGNAFPKCPAPWWNNSLLNDHLVHNIQHWNEGFIPINDFNKKPYLNKENVTIDCQNPTGEDRIKAVTLDGLWMCAHKRVFKQCKFDEDTFKGFHCYDTDICLQVNQYYDVYVVYDILIEHLSMGTVAKTWAEAAEVLADKWIDKLPLFKKEVDPSLISSYNSKCLLTYCYWIQSMGFSDSKIRMTIKKYLNCEDSFWSSREYLLLKLWSKFGFATARISYRVFKSLIKSNV
jgi:hypothetical protein